MTIGQWQNKAEQTLKDKGFWSSRLDSQLLLSHVVNHPREWVLAHPEEVLEPDQITRLDDLLQKRLSHIPLVHLTGHKEFYGLEFEITPDVLTPRAETEPMVEWAIKLLPEASTVIDMGTGSGALAIALAKHRPDLKIMATDVSKDALVVARRNARAHDVRLEFATNDIWNGIDRKFDAILTNLPYLTDDADLTPEVKQEPRVALVGGPDGLDLYRRMLGGVPDHLSEDGYLFTECDPWQQAALQKEASRHRLEVIDESYFVLGFQRKSQKAI